MIKRKATVYCDALGCPVNQTVLMIPEETSEPQLRRIGWTIHNGSGRAFCPSHTPPENRTPTSDQNR